MESFLSFFSKELAQENQFNPTFKNRFILKRSFSLKDSLQRTVYRYRYIFMNCGL
jgi:hypothetical protein